MIVVRFYWADQAEKALCFSEFLPDISSSTQSYLSSKCGLNTSASSQILSTDSYPVETVKL